MNNPLLEPMLSKLEYEERVRWLHSLHRSQSNPDQPGSFAQLSDTVLYVLGGSLVALGERMQSRHNMDDALPTIK